MSPGELIRFIHEVALRYTGNECLTWPFGKVSKGYGLVSIDGKKVVASRYVCELAHGAPPTPKHDAAHSCGKGDEGCITQSHLSWKTRAENMADKLIHGSHNRGERHNMVKLTEAEAREILSLKGIETQRATAARLGITRSNVSAIHRGKSWAWLSEGVAA